MRGWYSHEGKITLDLSLMDRAGLETVLMHEIGHSLGFGHRRYGGIMCSMVKKKFNEVDLEQCKELGYCK